MKHLFFALLACLTFSAVGCSTTMHPAEKSKSPFEQMKTLAGRWETTPIGHDSKETVVYHLTSGGSALEETLFPNTPHEMVSVYHEEQGDLVMTHYCMLGNQPKLKAEQLSPDKILFHFAGGAGINPDKDRHMHELQLSIVDQNHIRQKWIGYRDGQQDDVKVIELTRVPG